MNVIEQNIVDALTNNYMPYTAYVIRERALPEIDGFKPSQRRILYTMFKMGLLKGGRKKSQGIVGQTMFLHPHGDASIYETLVRMAKDSESLLHPYIDSKGNFGKQFSRDMKYASARYTEVRLQEIAQELFKDINKDIVDMIDNYDSTLKEPKMLPVTFPTILVNPQSGIANGMASNMTPFNLNEVLDYVINYIQNPKSTKITDYITAPDFPTGGNIIKDEKAISDILNTGRGSVLVRATYEIKENSIVFTDLPYNTTFEAVIDKISKLVKENKLKDIVDIDNIFGINSKGIEVTVKKNVTKELMVEKLFKMTPLQSSFSANHNIVIDGKPKVLGVKEIVFEWLKFRANSIKRSIQFDVKKKEEKLHVLLGLKEIMVDIDKAIKIIRETKKNSEVVKNLMDGFNVDKIQAEYIADIKLKFLNEEYLIERVNEMQTLKDEIQDLNDIISNRSRLAMMIVDELKIIKEKYGQERKTKVIEVKKVSQVMEEINQEENYPVKVFITKEGYVKKIPLTSLRGNFTIKIKDGDEFVKTVETTSSSDLLVFTDKQNLYKIRLCDMEDHKPSSMGDFVSSTLGLKDENILYMTITNDYSGNLVIGFDDGKVAKIDMKAYYTKQNRKMLTKAYADKKALYFNHLENGQDIDIMAVSSIDKALMFNTILVNSKSSKTSIGSQVMKSKNDSKVIRYFTTDHLDEQEKTDANYYRVMSAGIGKFLRKEDKFFS